MSKDFIEFIKNMPKVELHLHLEGAFTFEFLFNLINKYGGDPSIQNIADLKNIGGRYAGAITAGKFLEHFTDSPFIHLDIAGPSFNKTRDSYRGKGGSGIGVRLLYDFIKKR